MASLGQEEISSANMASAEEVVGSPSIGFHYTIGEMVKLEREKGGGEMMQGFAQKTRGTKIVLMKCTFYLGMWGLGSTEKHMLVRKMVRNYKAEIIIL